MVKNSKEPKKRGLGRGLEALFDETPQVQETEEITEISLDEIRPNPYQPRKTFDNKSLKELSESIKENGVFQPIIIRKSVNGYEIIAGERRWRAAKLAGLKEVPVIVKEYTDIEVVEISLIENIQREDLNPIEEAIAFKRLLTEFNLKQDEVAERVSKSRTAVTNSMRLLKLCEKVQQMVIDDMISTGHARALLAIEDADSQYELAVKIFDEKLSVRDVEKLMKDLNKPVKENKIPKKDEKLEIIYGEIEEKIKQSLSTKVAISSKGNGSGKIEIEFYSHDDLEKITDKLIH